ncbi:EamA family transporter RarD [Breznakiella homolactica]|uniref:EamA family transporter RarD n=1 Tax=Breznakiella homolactica TaxID=2798577 RepID=A0A7T7XKV6_9SPIR|nr:EamA family transporter RarD [Breznakiella homolactica]QQO08170.1 EamA family transporter RarD [Breznakiella homolactica]
MGVFYAVIAYVFWGLSPLYWRFLSNVGPLQILAFRILFSLIFVFILLKIQKTTCWFRLFKEPRSRIFIIGAALAVTVNWGGYIWAVNSGMAVAASLGYFICPLISILLGVIFLREKILPLQWVSFGIAAFGVVLLSVFTGSFPWISFILALSFGGYGLFKKKITAGSLEGLFSETLVSSPLAAAMLFIPAWGGTDFPALPVHTWVLLVLCGPVTVAPLYWFSKSARHLSLSALGFLQYLNPTIQFLLGVFVFREPFPRQNLTAFICIWVSVLLFSAAPMIQKRIKT